MSVQAILGTQHTFFMCLTSVNINQCHHQQFHTTTYIFSFVIMSSFLLKKTICGKLCFSVSIWRNRLPNRIEYLWTPMATMLYRKQCAELVWPTGFNNDNFEWQEACKSAQEGWGLSIAGSFGRGRSQKMLAEQLGVFQAAISMRLHAMGKVQKIGKWVPHETMPHWTIGR